MAIESDGPNRTGSENQVSEKWSSLDDQAVVVSRALAMDAVQKVGNGHPGTAMALAPVAYTLFQRVLKHDPTDPNWLGRDRFVLSAGHSSLTLYIQLFLSGYGLELSDLQSIAASLTHSVVLNTLTGVDVVPNPLAVNPSCYTCVLKQRPSSAIR